jgi:phosphate transport system protein
MVTLIENQIKEIESNLKDMIQLVLHMHRDARLALQQGDAKLALSVIKRDEEVNNLDEVINESALSFLATQAPVAKDLRTTMAMIRVANDVERIGDYAKTISEFIILSKPLYTPFKDYIEDMYQNFDEMFQAATSLFFQPVLEKTYEISKQDQLIDAKLKKAFKEIPTVGNVDNILSVLDTFNIIRTLERAGDHTKNICEAVIFKIKGKKIDLG